MRKGLDPTFWLLILIGSLVALQTSDALAQRKDRKERKEHKARPERVVANPPAKRTRIVAGRNQYEYAHGVFYRPGPKGYIAVRGPVGARIRTLPPGYISFQIGGAPFFFYFGTYYRFDAPTREYVVVAPPPGAPTVPGLDQVNLITGESVNGTFVGGTQSTVQVDVDGNVREIPIDQIVSVIFAPSEQ